MDAINPLTANLPEEIIAVDRKEKFRVTHYIHMIEAILLQDFPESVSGARNSAIRDEFAAKVQIAIDEAREKLVGGAE